jgi:hypothetical protein
MSQAIATTPQVTSIRGKIHTNEPVNPLSIVRITKEESRWDGREYEGYPCILIEIEDEGKQKWFYAKGDEATRDADYTTLDAMINNLASGLSPLLYDAVVDAGGGGDYLLPSAAIAGGACSIFVRAGVYNEADDIALASSCSIIGESSGAVIIFPATKGIKVISPTASTTAGTISVTNGSSTIVSSVSAFLAGDVGKYIRVGLSFYKIASFTNTTTIDIDRDYNGKTEAGLDYFVREMVVGVTIQKLNLQGGGVSDSLIEFDGVIMSTIDTVLLDSSSVDNISLFESGVMSIEHLVSRSSLANGIKIDKSFGVKLSESTFYTNSINGVYMLGLSEGITLDTCFSLQNKGDGVCVEDCKKVTIVDTHSNKNVARGIQAGPLCQNVIIDSCQIANNGGVGITNGGVEGIVNDCFIEGGTNGVNTGDRGHVEGNHIKDCSGTGIFVTFVGVSSAKIIGNSISNVGGTGIIVEGGNNTITSNSVSSPGSNGIDCNSSNNNTITSNTVTGVVGADAAIEVASTDGNKLNHNVFDSNSNDYFLDSATNTEVDGVTYNTLSTTTATATTIATISIPTNGREYSFKVYVSAERSTGNKFGTWHRTLVVNKSIGGVPTITLFNADIDAQTGLIPTSVSAVVNGGDIDIQVTGNAGETFRWVEGHKFLTQAKFFIA